MVPRKTGRWSRLWAFVRRGYAALDAQLAAYYRLCHLAAPSAPALVSRTVTLRGREVLSIDRRQAVRLEVRSGIVWLTATPSAGDVILQSGDHFTLGDASPYVVEAVQEAVIVLHGSESPTA